MNGGKAKKEELKPPADFTAERIRHLSAEEIAAQMNNLIAEAEAVRRALEAEREKATKSVLENETLKAEVWELRVDPRTGLERDLLYHRRLNEKIANLIERGHLTAILEKESLKDLTKEEIADLDSIPLSVTQADIGYLSKYNEDPEIGRHYGEHGGGDEILKRSGAIIQRTNFEKRSVLPQLHPETKGYRVGGDELALVHDLVKEEAQKVALEFSKRHSLIRIEGADLPPSINCGTASFREAVEVMMRAFPTAERKKMAPEEQAKELQKFLTHIADRRARVAKGLERLLSMAELKIEDPEAFKRNYRWMQKGAFGMEEKDFDELSAMLQSPSALHDHIKKIVREKLETQVKREDDRRLLERGIVVDIADRDLLE